MSCKMLPEGHWRGLENGTQKITCKIHCALASRQVLKWFLGQFWVPKSDVGFATFFALEQRSCSWPSWDLFVASLVPSCGNFGSFSGHPGSKTAAIQQQYSSNTAANQQQTSSNTEANQPQPSSKPAAN